MNDVHIYNEMLEKVRYIIRINQWDCILSTSNFLNVHQKCYRQLFVTIHPEFRRFNIVICLFILYRV